MFNGDFSSSTCVSGMYHSNSTLESVPRYPFSCNKIVGGCKNVSRDRKVLPCTAKLAGFSDESIRSQKLFRLPETFDPGHIFDLYCTVIEGD